MEGRTRDEGVCCETLKGEKTREGGGREGKGDLERETRQTDGKYTYIPPYIYACIERDVRLSGTETRVYIRISLSQSVSLSSIYTHVHR